MFDRDSIPNIAISIDCLIANNIFLYIWRYNFLLMANRPQPITLSTQIITEIYTNMHVTARKLDKLYSWKLDLIPGR